jgi:hypothetical protein
VFGEAQGKEEKYFSEPDAPAAKGLPLRTITGHVNKVRHKSAHNKRAIAAVVFEFGEPKGLSR